MMTLLLLVQCSSQVCLQSNSIEFNLLSTQITIYTIYKCLKCFFSMSKLKVVAVWSGLRAIFPRPAAAIVHWKCISNSKDISVRNLGKSSHF